MADDLVEAVQDELEDVFRSTYDGPGSEGAAWRAVARKAIELGAYMPEPPQ